MLSQKLHEAINAQINAELWSAYLYLAMSTKVLLTGSMYNSKKNKLMHASS